MLRALQAGGVRIGAGKDALGGEQVQARIILFNLLPLCQGGEEGVVADDILERIGMFLCEHGIPVSLRLVEQQLPHLGGSGRFWSGKRFRQRREQGARLLLPPAQVEAAHLVQ